jgi:hypothetical protein
MQFTGTAPRRSSTDSSRRPAGGSKLPYTLLGENDDRGDAHQRARARGDRRALERRPRRRSGWNRARASLYAGTPLLALVGIYWLFALASNLNIGHRHLLPIYPALCGIVCGGAAFWIRPLFPRANRIHRRLDADDAHGRPRR